MTSRRGVWRLAVGTVAALMVAGLGGGALAARACAAPLAVYPHLAVVEQTLASPADPASETAGVLAVLSATARSAGHAVLTNLLAVKQNDALAYPAHVALARALATARCAPEAVRQQWVKAGLHAATDATRAEQVAAALAASVRSPAEATALVAWVRAVAEAEPWSVGIRHVEAALVAQLGTDECPHE